YRMTSALFQGGEGVGMNISCSCGYERRVEVQEGEVGEADEWVHRGWKGQARKGELKKTTEWNGGTEDMAIMVQMHALWLDGLMGHVHFACFDFFSLSLKKPRFRTVQLLTIALQLAAFLLFLS